MNGITTPTIALILQLRHIAPKRENVMNKTITTIACLATSCMLAPSVLAKVASPSPAVTAAQQQPDSDAAKRKRAAEILHQMLSPEIADSMASGNTGTGFGAEMPRIAFENAYVQLWTRPGLNLRDRSLVTISMLIALGTPKELDVHVASGLRNGVTPQELEEVIYHASAYAGFPKASEALAIARRAITQQQAR